MDYRIDQVVELDDGYKYKIVDQGIYNGKNYYLIVRIKNDSLSDEFSIVEESNNRLMTVFDDELLKALASYFEKRNK